MLFTTNYTEQKALHDKQKADELKKQAKVLDNKANEFLMHHMLENNTISIEDKKYGKVTYVKGTTLFSIDKTSLLLLLEKYIPKKTINLLVKKCTKVSAKNAYIKYFNVNTGSNTHIKGKGKK